MFDRLDINGKRLAKQAVEDLLAGPVPRNTYVAVFVLDTRLNGIQEFTADRDLLTKAVDHATAGLYSQYAHDSEAILDKLERMAGAPAASGQRDEALRAIMKRTLSSELRVARSLEGRRQLEGLLTLAREQSRIPGRKTVVYFCEGLTVPREIRELLDTVIGVANRTNVAFYAVDVRGLQALPISANPADLGNTVEQMHPDNNVPASNRINLQQTQMNLAALADGTGGFLAANSNDLRVPMRRVMEQVRSHYELFYVPSNTSYDGRFRRIEVRLSRPGLKVQTRSGYYAVPLVGGETLLPYEMGLLSALDARPAPHDVPFRAEVARFNKRGGAVECSLHIEIPLSKLEPAAESDSKTRRLHVSWMGLIKDRSGEIRQKLSRDLPFALDLRGAADVLSSDLSQAEVFDLEPGNYTLETAVLDRVAMKAGARRIALNIPAPAGLRVSDIVHVNRVEPLQGQPDRFNPLEFPGGRVVPSLSGEVRAAAGVQAGFYFVIYALESSAENPTLTIELSSEGQMLAKDSPALDAAGRKASRTLRGFPRSV